MKERVFHGPSHNVSISVDVIYYPACLFVFAFYFCFLGYVWVGSLCVFVLKYVVISILCSRSVPPVLSLCFLFSVMSLIMVIVDLCLLCLV